MVFLFLFFSKGELIKCLAVFSGKNKIFKCDTMIIYIFPSSPLILKVDESRKESREHYCRQMLWKQWDLKKFLRAVFLSPTNNDLQDPNQYPFYYQKPPKIPKFQLGCLLFSWPPLGPLCTRNNYLIKPYYLSLPCYPYFRSYQPDIGLSYPAEDWVCGRKQLSMN